MQLITNKISTGKPGRFEDFIKKFKASQVKTASVKTAEEQDEAESSGQLKVEPLHQTGESTTMPKNGPSAKKDDGEKAAAADTDPEKEGEDSGQPKAEGSEKFTNDPKVPGKEEKGGSAAATVKVAETCESCNCPKDECECKDCTAEVDEDETDKKEKTAALEDLPQEVQDKIKGKKTDDSDDADGDTKPAADASDSDDSDSDVEAKEKDKETKEASHKCDDCDCDPCTCKDKKASKSVKFVKWANLDSKNKSFLTTYWRQLFGDDYVNALVSDK